DLGRFKPQFALWSLIVSIMGISVITTVGTDVVLTCTYDAKYYGPLSVCWGRGAIPNSGCGDQVIKADGTSVVSRLSERYVLRGNLGQGDVSLTILQAVEADSGIYGCRVDIPGWFNDQKQEVTLTVKPGTAAAHDKKRKIKSAHSSVQIINTIQRIKLICGDCFLLNSLHDFKSGSM
uniref:Ig-like domain-containing protein n=1 Tax=Oryzias sinensis TaxID=183150 RepID=A0A8C7ZRM5_9TELE